MGSGYRDRVPEAETVQFGRGQFRIQAFGWAGTDPAPASLGVAFSGSMNVSRRFRDRTHKIYDPAAVPLEFVV